MIVGALARVSLAAHFNDQIAGGSYGKMAYRLPRFSERDELLCGDLGK
jgi:hypothetical protein